MGQQAQRGCGRARTNLGAHKQGELVLEDLEKDGVGMGG